MSLSKITKYLFSPSYRFLVNASKGFYKRMDDLSYLKKMYFAYFGKELNLDNPKTFNEKTQWLKLFDRNERYIQMADKYDAKKYIDETLGSGFSVPTIGIYKDLKDIDFNNLPNSYVIKTTHDSGGFVIVKDKNNLDIKELTKKINKSLKNKYFYYQREWPYKFIQPRIIVEPYLLEEGQEQCPEFKLFCFNGKVELVLVCLGSAHGSGRSNDFFDKNFNHIPVDTVFKQYDKGQISKPKYYNQMIEAAEKLAKNTLFLRVDFYCLTDRFYIGELTFYHNAGLCHFDPEEYDEKFGNLLKLPINKSE